MIVGVDFDNTIVCYDTIFHRIAVEQGLIPPDVPAGKTAVRDYLRAQGRDRVFTELQGLVYGSRLVEAEEYPGAKAFFRWCREHGMVVKIISHKSRFPYAGERYDLHAAALGWLEHNGFFQFADVGLPRSEVFFELTKADKLARIAAEGCDVFVDDLPELLSDPAFPASVKRILFDPSNGLTDGESLVRVKSWAEVRDLVLGLGRNESTFGKRSPAHRLFEQAGLRAGADPVRLPGGGNNRVYDVRNAEGVRFLLKEYFHQAGESRSRFDSERSFYALAETVAAGRVPRALAWNADDRMGLFEWVEGRRLTESEVGAAELDAAIQFFAQINRDRDRPEAQALPQAAEACFNAADHIATVDRRIARLVDVEIEEGARRFVREELVPVWQEMRSALASSQAFESALPNASRCISPSDFGFHNALRRPDGSLVFLDFEYAGWDDPAKTVCDFFCQPAVPVPMAHFEAWACGVAESVQEQKLEAFVARCQALLPVYRIKWCCILLNEFISADRGRREFALGGGATEARKTGQLASARRLLNLTVRSIHGTAA